MANIPLTLRLIKGSKLTFAELDNNFLSLAGGINNLPQNDSFVTGGTFNQSTNSIDFTGNYDFIPFSTDLSYLASDITVTGGTYNPSNGTVTFYNNSGGTFQVSGFLTGYTNYYTTGVTLNSTTLEFDRTDLSNAYSVDLSSLLFTGNTSGNCITDLYVSNIHSCSPLNINPLDEGNVYFGSTSGVTIDVSNSRLGIGTDSPEYRFVTTGSTGYFYYDGDEVRSPYRQSELAILGPSSGITNVSVKQFPTSGKTIELGMFVVGEDTPNSALWRGFGNSGDTALYASSSANDLNIINSVGSGTTDNINFFVGSSGNLTNSTPDLHIHGSGSTRGYVGIGTSSPSYKLQVNGTYGSMSYDPNRVRVSGDTYAGAFDSELILSGTTSGLTIINLVNGINSLGLISIGDDSGSTIYGNGGDTSIFNSSAARNLNIINSNGFGNDNIRFYAGQTASGTTPDIHIQGSGSTRGYVGIGTTTPSEKLEVSGKIKTTNFQMTSGATNGYVLTSDASGNGSWQLLPVSSGIFGISNSGGTYTYYSGITDAMSAATSGQTIQQFANVTETGNVTITWKDGVNFNGNGYTYTHSYSAGDSNTINIPATTVTCTINNWRVIRTGRANGTSTDYTFNVVQGGFSNNASRITFNNVYMESTYGTAVYISAGAGLYKGNLYGKGYLYGIFAHSEIQDMTGESTWASPGIYIGNVQSLYNCKGLSLSGYGIQNNGGNRLVNSTGISTSNTGLYGGSHYNCVGISTSGPGGFGGGYNSTYISTSGVAGDGVQGANNTLISSTSYGWYTFFPGYKLTNSTIISTSNLAAYTRGAILKNCVIRSEYNNSAGHAISEWFNDSVSKIISCDLEVTNASAYCIASPAGALNMKIANCSYDGATIPVQSNITQTITNTQDNQGNIVL